MIDRIEILILRSLVFNEDYSRRVLPFIKPQYFTDIAEKVVYEKMADFILKYDKLPTKESLFISITKDESLSDTIETSIREIIASLEPTDVDLQWLLEQTESWCKDRALYLALMDSIKIADDKKGKLSKGSIPKILTDALSVSFDPNVGHNYLEDTDSRFDFYHKVEEKLPFDIDCLNIITKDGVPRKTLNVLMAGCVHPSTKVKIRFKKRKTNWIEKEIDIVEIDTLMANGYDVQIYSPDGYVPVENFVRKGLWKEYKLFLTDGREVLVNENHLFETPNGWKYAKDLCGVEELYFTDSGIISGTVVETNNIIPIVDISVGHENHRYYANGISSHNTAVGKSLALCHIASSYFMQGKNVLYITLEMSEARIAERIDANLLNISLEDLHNIPKDLYDKRIKSLKSKTVGRLIIKEYPTASASSTHFRSLLNELNLKTGFVPDAIFIDYLNIAISSRLSANSNANSYTYVKSIAEELRGLAVEFNLPIWTATQTNRQGYASTDIGLENTSESFGLPATADFMLALSTSEELDKLGQILIKQLKNRYNDVSRLRRFVVGIDRSKMRLFDLEKSAQSELIDTDLYKRASNKSFDKPQKPATESSVDDFDW